LADVNPKIEELNVQLQAELNRWELLGVDPNQVVNFNPTKIDIWVQALTKFLANKEIIDEDEFVIFFKEEMLRIFKTLRTEAVEPEIAKHKIHVPNKGMFN
jgi:hypothetical protein